jgi:hypothetical protein
MSELAKIIQDDKAWLARNVYGAQISGQSAAFARSVTFFSISGGRNS